LPEGRFGEKEIKGSVHSRQPISNPARNPSTGINLVICPCNKRMTQPPIAFNLKKLTHGIDWKLLLFLVLFLDVKLAVKVVAIALIYLLNFNFKFGFKLKDPRLPLFYPIVIGLALTGYLLNGRYTNLNYNIVFVTGISFWLVSTLAIHQIKLAVERNTTEIINQTIAVFFTINTVVSLLNIGVIIIHTHALNPFTYQGEYQKYFISTGDFIKGLTFDSSITNSVINAFGAVYFLTRKNFLMTLVCMAILLLTASNFINIFILMVFAVLFIFKSNRDQKKHHHCMYLFPGSIHGKNIPAE
jgi:hypothetical protein